MPGIITVHGPNLSTLLALATGNPVQFCDAATGEPFSLTLEEKRSYGQERTMWRLVGEDERGRRYVVTTHAHTLTGLCRHTP